MRGQWSQYVASDSVACIRSLSRAPETSCECNATDVSWDAVLPLRGERLASVKSACQPYQATTQPGIVCSHCELFCWLDARTSPSPQVSSLPKPFKRR